MTLLTLLFIWLKFLVVLLLFIGSMMGLVIGLAYFFLFAFRVVSCLERAIPGEGEGDCDEK